jgi:hypothetical protein
MPGRLVSTSSEFSWPFCKIAQSSEKRCRGWEVSHSAAASDIHHTRSSRSQRRICTLRRRHGCPSRKWLMGPRSNKPCLLLVERSVRCVSQGGCGRIFVSEVGSVPLFLWPNHHCCRLREFLKCYFHGMDSWTSVYLLSP